MLNPYNRITRDALRNTELPHPQEIWLRDQPWKKEADEEVQRGRSTEALPARELHAGMSMGPQTSAGAMEQVHREKVIGKRKYTGDGQTYT